jgi:hypothetical protein
MTFAIRPRLVPSEIQRARRIALDRIALDRIALDRIALRRIAIGMMHSA